MDASGHIEKVVLQADAAYKAGNYCAALKFLKSVGDPLSECSTVLPSKGEVPGTP